MPGSLQNRAGRPGGGDSDSDVDLPRTQAGANPQHLLLTLLGDYWYGRDAPLPSAALVDLLAEFSVSGVSARAALSRLARRGLLVLSRSGRRTYYALSPRAAEVLTEGTRHILSFGSTETPWWGRWTVAVFSIPEGRRDLRHLLRTRLRSLGLASLYDGVWISPHDRVEQVSVVLKELGVSSATVMAGEIGPDSPPGGDPLRAWDLAELRRRYDELVRDYAGLRARCRAGRISAAEALVTRTALMAAWRTFPGLDPDLPPELLPGDWPRARARQTFVELYDGLAALAESRVREILAGHGPDLAPLVRSHGTRFAG
ncbi:MAG: PaaX family transcriptional regulator [Micromonosporaceae bacterium]|nr:PaaX family transcriptional regulator [Micromonosporaceae bacterium]